MTPDTSADQQALKVENIAVAMLRPCRNNARLHSSRQVHQIAASIREFGFNNPVLIDRKNQIIAGHGRAEAAKVLGLDVVPCIRIEHLSEEQKRAYIIADNKLALNAGWDPEILAIELQHLSSLDLPFDLEITGFETAEIDALIDHKHAVAADEAADLVPPVQHRAVSRAGDLWILGDHKLLCADAREPSAYEMLLERKARLCFTDPPYNVKIDGHVCGLGSVRHGEFAMACGEMTHGGVRRLLAVDFPEHGGSKRRWGDPFYLHGLAPYRRGVGRGQAGVFGFEEPLRVEQDQWGDGIILPLEARTGFCVQGRRRPSSQHNRAWQGRPLSHQCVGLCRRQYVRTQSECRPIGSSDRKAGGFGLRRDQGLLASGRRRA